MSDSLKKKIEANIWDDIQRDFLPVLQRALLPYGDPHKWVWSRNTDCKYVELRVDMRDGGCIICDRHGNRISPEQLQWQYSEGGPKRPDGEGT